MPIRSDATNRTIRKKVMPTRRQPCMLVRMQALEPAFLGCHPGSRTDCCVTRGRLTDFSVPQLPPYKMEIIVLPPS